MTPTPKDGPGNERANIIKLNPQPDGPPCSPEVEQRIRQAIAFLLGEIFDAKEEAVAKLDAFEDRIAALELISDRSEGQLHLFEKRFEALEQQVKTLSKRLEMQEEYRATLWADYDERKQAEQRAIDEAEWAAAHLTR